MLAKAPTAADVDAVIGAVAEELSLAPPTERPPERPASVPPLPPIEEYEKQPRRRKKSNLRTLVQRVTEEDGVEWIERLAIARPGYRIIGIRHRTCAGHPQQFVVHTQRIRRIRRKANGKANGNGGSNA
jgi:hypothetical protein